MALSSCHEVVRNPNENLTSQAFEEFSVPEYALDSRKIRKYIDSLIRNDGDAVFTDRRVRKYYAGHEPFIWIGRNCVLGRADTTLSCLRQAYACGIDTVKLRVELVSTDIAALRSLDVEALRAENNINKRMARVEYNLTRAYLRYVAGQRFGFVDPDRLYNRFEKCDSDTVSGQVKYSHLYDLRVQRPDSLFYATAIRKAFNDSVGQFIRSVQPSNALYVALVERLNGRGLSDAERLKTLCNIERCRWRQRGVKPLSASQKHVVVNVPSCSLRAVNGANVLNMRVGVGTSDHKTPVLTSTISRMDINPQWIIPKSISKGIVGRSGYMHSEGMFVYDKRRGKLPPEAALYNKVMEGEQFIIQAGGPKNPLGRIIFRFKNNFAVFLHDTSSPWIFKRDRRDVSHGCVRVEKPLDLALFMLNGDEEELPAKIEYSMTMPFANDNDSLNVARIDRKLLVNSVKVQPEVPIFITYYTVFYGNGNELVSYVDLYGYDDVLIDKLSPFIETSNGRQ